MVIHLSDSTESIGYVGKPGESLANQGFHWHGRQGFVQRIVQRLACLPEARGKVQLSSHLCRETGVEIAQSSDEPEQLRTRLRKMSDAQLVNFGKAARFLRRDPKVP